MRNYAEMCEGIWSYNLVYNFLIQLLPVFVVHFLIAFWHENEALLKGCSQNEIVPFLVIFHLPYSKYKGVKIYFYSCRYQNQHFSLAWHSCHSCSTRAALVSHLRRSRLAPVSFVLHPCRSCPTCVTRVWHSCCKLDQIESMGFPKLK